MGAVCAAPAFAQEAPAPATPTPEKPNASGFYAGGGINLFFLDRDYAAEGMPIFFEDQPSPGAFMGRLGYAFNENIAIEVEAGIGGARSEFTTSGGGSDGEIGIETPLGAHVILSAPINRNTYILGKVGYVSAKVSSIPVSTMQTSTSTDRPSASAPDSSLVHGTFASNTP